VWFSVELHVGLSAGESCVCVTKHHDHTTSTHSTADPSPPPVHSDHSRISASCSRPTATTDTLPRTSASAQRRRPHAHTREGDNCESKRRTQSQTQCRLSLLPARPLCSTLPWQPSLAPSPWPTRAPHHHHPHARDLYLCRQQQASNEVGNTTRTKQRGASSQCQRGHDVWRATRSGHPPWGRDLARCLAVFGNERRIVWGCGSAWERCPVTLCHADAMVVGGSEQSTEIQDGVSKLDG
jgi:hypothetical protein